MCAFLAAICLIPLLGEHYDIVLQDKLKISSEFHLYTNNQSIIEKLQTIDEYPIVYLKTVCIRIRIGCTLCTTPITKKDSNPSHPRMGGKPPGSMIYHKKLI